MAVTIDLNPQSEKHNAKQRKFFDDVMSAVHRSHELEKMLIKIETAPESQQEAMQAMIDDMQDQVNKDPRYWHYGGAVSGGKTIITLLILCVLCKIYPQSRWHVIRQSMPDLERTAQESLTLILADSSAVVWKKKKSDYFCQFANGSRIYFLAENYDRDKDLNRFKGLMTNGFLLEQAEELQYKTFEKAIERAGRWLGVKGPMPPPLILTTFNPTFGWLKKRVHDAFRAGKPPKGHYYLQALPHDNPWNTEEMWRSWENLDPETYSRFIEGNWELKVDNAFFHQFSDRNVKPCDFDWREDIWLSFDFNVDPMTCVIGQTDGQGWIRIIKEFRQPNSDTYALCDQISPFVYGREHLIKVTGDASGKNRMSGTRGHINQYEIIKNQLSLSYDQFVIPSVNPSIADSRTFMNSLLYRFPEFIIDPSCEYTIQDLRFVETDFDRDGNLQIKKAGVNKSLQISNAQIGHLSDCVRYLCHVTLYHWFKT